jgi:predicted esterase
MNRVHLHSSWLALFCLSSLASAQDTRYELGQRLREFEKEWDKVTDATARKRAVPHLKRATTAFFTFSPEEAARALDLARLSLGSEKDPDSAVLWAQASVFKPKRRLIPLGDELQFSLEGYYPSKVKYPKELKLKVSFLSQTAQSVEEDLREMNAWGRVRLRVWKDGDYPLKAEIRRGETTLASSVQTLSVVDRLTDRLEKIEKELPRYVDRKTTDCLTAASLTALLKRLAAGETLETNYPAARLLNEVEFILLRLKENQPFYTKDYPGEFWLDLAPGKRPVRVLVPEAAREGKPMPLVIALHGAGGSENMFFDAYGHGLIARLCAARGWLLAAPRNGLSDGVLEELARLYPVDRKKVFLVGHSMGAAQAMAAANRQPERFSAVAALGGGGTVTPSEGLRKVSFFVGVGKEDFALRAARSLKSGLESAKVEKLKFKEYDDIEHLLIVQHCLPEVFKIFDEVAKR